MTVLRDPARFSSVKPKNVPGMERVDFFNGQPVMNYSDDPDHARLRRIVAPAFMPRRVQEAGEVVAGFIEEILAPIGQGQLIDAAAQICRPLATRLLLGHFMGVAPQDHRIFLNYVSTLYLLDKLRPGDPKPQAFLDAWEKGRAYCRRALEEAKRNGTQNLISVIGSAQESGTLSDSEMMAMMVLMFTGGFSTVAAAAASSLYHLAENPDIAARIRKDPALATKHLEESLRMDPPVTLVMRFAAEDTELGGKTVCRDMPIYTLISVADRDPAEFSDPGRFDIDRANIRHVTFGHGIHVCIGNNITRVAVPLLIRAAVERYPALRLDPEAAVVWETTPRSRHMKVVPLRT
jgi:cytochrome P450